MKRIPLVYLISVIAALINFGTAWSQTAIIKGKVISEFGDPVEMATVRISNNTGTVTDTLGRFELVVPADVQLYLEVSHVAFIARTYEIKLKPGQVETYTIKLNILVMGPVTIKDEGKRDLPEINIDPSNIQFIATPGDPLMALLRTAGLGIATNNELGSGYSVRGGNFDENLIYVNDVEIYRPFLARSGQQEGLSFINADMIQTLSFSSGGYEAKYGDKMSSVLDITYRKPLKFAMTVQGGLLGASIHMEDAIIKNRIKYSVGFRYKTNNYVLSALDTKGDYQPNFLDFQSFLTYDISEKVEINFMGSYSDNNYQVIPHNRQTTFGHVQEAKQLNVFFDGQEITRFQVGSAALIFNFKPKNGVHKLIASMYKTSESEKFDILGQYYLGEIESDPGDPNFGEVTNTVGVGGFLNHARNQLEATVFSGEMKSKIFITPKRKLYKDGNPNRNSMSLAWGAKYQHEEIFDKLDEWNLLDSSGYLLPYNGPSDTVPIVMQDIRKSKINLSSNRIQAYFQQSFFWMVDSHRISLTAGVRAQYWDLNGEFLFSPRVQFAWQPNWKPDILFRLCGGIYYQAPFYRELRDLNGVVNTNVKAQRSIHAVLGFDYNFKIWSRPFKFITEVYYKHLDNLNPYEIDNIRIRYYARNNSSGYATGIDMKLGGEFIEGLDSWLMLSVMGTAEDIKDDFYVSGGDTVNPGFIPRPTDQRVTFGLFFQDHIPKFEALRVHLSMLFGSQLPFGPPNDNRHSDTLRAPFYRRVDIGFSFVILKEDRKIKRPKSFMRHFKTLWVGVEIFNLFDIDNTISYFWVRDITNRQYAVPNYLTPRLINARLVAKF